MDTETWQETIFALPVFDTHTHLNMPGVPIPAQTFWDIAHYFWFQEELWATGYPHNAMQLSENERIERFVDAFEAARSTVWALIVRRIFADLYGIRLRGAASIREADAAVRAHALDPGWAVQVAHRISLKRITVNNLRESDFPELPGFGVVVPMWDAMADWQMRILKSPTPQAEADQAREAAHSDVRRLRTMGIRGMRVEADPFELGGRAAVLAGTELPARDLTAATVARYLTHVLFEALGEQDMFAQLFLGIERSVTPHTAMAVDDPRRITNLYPLFEMHPCGFELVLGAPGNNMDAVQAARIYPNAYLGGLWWYNFRSSTYQHAMQCRLEAVPAAKAALIASDARCIEWCYGKILMVKLLLSQFLRSQIERGWISEEDATWVAKTWLYDAAAQRYV